MNLMGEFPGRSQDESDRFLRSGVRPTLSHEQVFENRKGEGRSLSGSGLGSDEQIGSGQSLRNRSLLNRCGLFVSQIGQIEAQLGRKSEINE